MADKSYRITQHQPWQRYLVIGGMLVILAILTVILIRPDAASTSDEDLNQAQTRTALINREISRLTTTNAKLNHDQIINRQLVKDLQLEIKQLNAESAEMKEELVFYQSLLSPSDREPGLHLRDVSIYQTKTSSEKQQYRYKIILTQVKKNQKFANGRIELSVNTKDKANPLIPVTIDNQTDLQFKFKYFQRLEGIVNIPTSHAITGLIVSVIPENKGLQSITEIFAWDTVMQDSWSTK